MLNDITNYFESLQAKYKKNSRHAVADGIKLGLFLSLFAVFFPVTNGAVAGVLKIATKILTPLLSITASAGLGYILTDLAANDIDKIIKNIYAKFSNISKNIPTTDDIKQAAHQAYEHVPTFTAVKAMIFSAVTPAANENEEKQQNVTGLKPRP